MSGHTPAEIQQEVRRYLIVFTVLIVGTILTVGASYLELPSFALTVALALFIATIKGFFVAGYFMHLMDEKKTIYLVLGTTAFFVTGLMFITLWAMTDPPTNTIYP
jgi:caa(3)-type oxidase subunit IV